MLNKELSGKVAIVTGAGKNIGRSIALSLAADGAAVAVNTRASRGDAENVVKEIRAAGGKAEVFMADVADAPAEQDRDHGAQQRGEDQKGDELLHDQPFIIEASSTAMSPRLRKKVTRMARPTAASAAATVSTNIAKICPVTFPR